MSTQQEQSYEERLKELNGILEKLDSTSTPIDELSVATRRGIELVNSLRKDLKRVETEIHDAFKALDDNEEDAPNF